jgi:hypothetical protein
MRVMLRRRQLLRRHKDLLAEPVRELPDGSRAVGLGRLHRRGDVNVLFLRGSAFEMAYQHGRLLGAEVRAGAPPASLGTLRRVVGNSLNLSPAIARYPAALLHKLFTDPVLRAAENDKRVAQHSLDEAIGMSLGSGLSVTDLLRSAATPEALQVLAGKLSAKPMGRALARHVPVCACSSFAAWGDHSSTGHMVIGRNMDYPLNGYYDRFPTVVYFDPTDTPHKFMSFLSAGCHTPGLTALNEHGIYVAIHTVFTRSVSTTRGRIAILTGAEIIRHAQTFDEAVAMFRAHPSNAGWAYLLVSTKEQRAAVIEMSADGVTVRDAKGSFVVQTNHYLSAESGDRGAFLCRAVDDDTVTRHRRLTERLQQGAVTAAMAADMLGDHMDASTGSIRGLGNTVGMHSTMSSLVVDAGSARVFVASGEAPVSHNAYVAFPFPGTADATADTFLASEAETLAPNAFKELHPAKYQAMRAFIRAKISFEHDNDAALAFAQLQEARTLDPDNAAYHLQGGILALRHKQIESARAALEQAASATDTTPHLSHTAQYYLARVCAQLGDTQRAAQLLGPLAQGDLPDLEDTLRDAAGDALARLHKGKSIAPGTRELGLLMQFSDLVEYA